MPSPFSDALTDDERRDAEEKRARELLDARIRWRDVLLVAGVPYEETANVLAGLERQGFVPTRSTGEGNLRNGFLSAAYYDPNTIRAERLSLTQHWQPLTEPPDPPWVPCIERFRIGLDVPRCEDTTHGEHYRSLVYGPMHRALPGEIPGERE